MFPDHERYPSIVSVPLEGYPLIDPGVSKRGAPTLGYGRRLQKPGFEATSKCSKNEIDPIKFIKLPT